MWLCPAGRVTLVKVGRPGHVTRSGRGRGSVAAGGQLTNTGAAVRSVSDCGAETTVCLGKVHTYKLQPTKFYEKGHWCQKQKQQS